MKKIFIQDVHILNSCLIVVCCDGTKELNNMVQKSKIVAKQAKKDLQNMNVDGMHGAVFYDTRTNEPLLLYMKNRKQDWVFFETLLHETNHIVFRYMQHVMTNQPEIEFEARLHEMLFREIRKKLQCG